MNPAMTIGVRTDQHFAKYDQFDPLGPDIHLFHEDCAGGTVSIFNTGNFIGDERAWKFLCKACGTGSPMFPAPDVRRALRALVVGRKQQHIRYGEECVIIIPIPPSPATPTCRACGAPVDPEKDEHAAFHLAPGTVVYLHTGCASPVQEDGQDADDGRLEGLLQELRVIARRQSEPIRRRDAT